MPACGVPVRPSTWAVATSTAWIFGAITVIKLLLLPAYRSTDFEVHRNWLAITHSLPLQQWYYEATSQWTLDYPPFFAWFEWCLSHAAAYFDPQMLVVNNLEYASFNTILFQRLSVMVTDLVLFLAVCMYASTMESTPMSHLRTKAAIVVGLVITHPGLLFVDHVHFQYNGVLMGLLIITIALIRQCRDLAAGAVFTVLLFSKHLFAYVAPLYFVYLLRHYCFVSSRFSFSRLLTMASVVLLIAGLAMGPFLIGAPAAHLKQMLSRLFPWGRGLCHAYWAPNLWALYNIADKVAVVIARRLGYPIHSSVAGLTGGLVQDTVTHTILPTIRPSTAAILTLVSMLPMLVRVWRDPQPKRFGAAIVFVSYSSFMLGWHVHEKAILMVVLPMALTALDSPAQCRLFQGTSAVAVFSLFPLLFLPKEAPVLFLASSTFAIGAWCICDWYLMQRKSQLQLSALERLYGIGAAALYLYALFGHDLLFRDQLPFLPLLLMSVYCALGLVASWIASWFTYSAETTC